MNRSASMALGAMFLGLASANAAQTVTPETYSRAEVDESFKSIVQDVGSNAFRHDRSLIPLDKQPAVTMHRDTVYSFGIFPRLGRGQPRDAARPVPGGSRQARQLQRRLGGQRGHQARNAAPQRVGGAGLLPAQDAVYIYRDYGLSGDACYEATYEKPDFEEGGFFSFTMYGADKYLKSDDSNLNSRAMTFNDDGTVTVRYGPKETCGDAANWLSTPGDDWYLGMRIYRPGESVVSGAYTIPEPTLVE